MKDLTLEQKLAKITELLYQKCGSNWSFDRGLLNEFNKHEVNAETNIDFKPSVERLGKVTTKREISDHERSVELPLSQALDVVINLLERDDVPANCYSTLIFLSTKRKTGATCWLDLWRRPDGWFKMDVLSVYPSGWWSKDTRVVRKS